MLPTLPVRHKHGISFDEAKTIFEDDHLYVFFDEAHSALEERTVAIGKSQLGNLLFVVHIEYEDSDTIRIISARKATRPERYLYEQGT